MSYIYLATPYSDPDEKVRHSRYMAAATAAAYLMKRTSGIVFAPTVYGHHMEEVSLGKMPHEFWMRIARAFLAKASNLYVLVAQGTGESKGVQAEIELAQQLSIPITYVGLRIEKKHNRVTVIRLTHLDMADVKLDEEDLRQIAGPKPEWD